MKIPYLNLPNSLKKCFLAYTLVLGCLSSHTANAQSPNAQFTVTPNSGPVPLQVTLDASDSSDSDGSIVSYQWSAPGQTTEGRKATMIFTDPGAYNIELVVIDETGESDTTRQTVMAIEASPKIEANFTVTPESGTKPLTVTLDASASQGNITDYEWSISNGQIAFGQIVTWIFSEAGTYTISLTVTTREGETATFQYPNPIVVSTKNEPPIITPTIEKGTFNSTARLQPQIIAAGVSPTQLDMTDDNFDIIALVRPGLSPIRTVSFQDTDGALKMAMNPAGVLPNGDELYKVTFVYERGSLGPMTFPTAWGSQRGQFNIIATAESQNSSHTYPYLMVGNFPDLTAATKSQAPVDYNMTARYAPQVVMAGYSPAKLDVGDDQFDVIAIVRPGIAPIKSVVLKQNQEEVFSQAMTLAGELDNGDKVYKYTYTYNRGELGIPENDEVIPYTDLWGPEAVQFGVEVIDDAQQRSHQFPNIEFGNYPELER